MLPHQDSLMELVSQQPRTEEDVGSSVKRLSYAEITSTGESSDEVLDRGSLRESIEERRAGGKSFMSALFDNNDDERVFDDDENDDEKKGKKEEKEEENLEEKWGKAT